MTPIIPATPSPIHLHITEKARQNRAFSVTDFIHIHLETIDCKDTIGVDEQTGKVEQTDNGEDRALLLS